MLTETRTTTTQPANHAAPAGIAPRAQRLPADTSLGRVRLQVADLERSLAWYQSVLGLKLLEREANAATLGTHADEPLVELRELAGARPVPRRGRLGLYHYALLLPDRPSLGAFLSHLAQTGERAGASDHLVSEALYLNDPDGLGIEVYADRPPRRVVGATPRDPDGHHPAQRGRPGAVRPQHPVGGHARWHQDGPRSPAHWR